MINAWCRWCMLLLINMTLKKINILEYAFGEGGGGHQKAYAVYAFINVDNCERPLSWQVHHCFLSATQVARLIFVHTLNVGRVDLLTRDEVRRTRYISLIRQFALRKLKKTCLVHLLVQRKHPDTSEMWFLISTYIFNVRLIFVGARASVTSSHLTLWAGGHVL